MNYGWVPWQDANAFCSTVIEGYADSDENIPGAAHLERFSSFEWQHFCLIMTNSLGSSDSSTSHGHRDCPHLRTGLETRAWLFGSKVLSLSRSSTRA